MLLVEIQVKAVSGCSQGCGTQQMVMMTEVKPERLGCLESPVSRKETLGFSFDLGYGV